MASKTAEKETRTLESALKEHPDSLLFARLADAYRKEGNILQAIELCDRGIKRYPEYVTARILLGRCYLEQQQADLAAKEFTAACSLDRRNQVAMKMLADIFLQQGLEQKAGDLFAMLRAMDPENATLKHLCAQYPSTGNSNLFSVLSLSPGTSLPEAAHSTSAMPNSTLPTQDEFLSDFSTDELPLDNSDSLSLPSGDDFDALFNDTPTEQEAAEAPDAELTGSDVSERMSELFGDLPPVATGQKPVHDTLSGDFTEEHDNSSDIESIIADITDNSTDLSGDDVSVRIDQLFTDNSTPQATIEALADTLQRELSASEPSQFDDSPALSLSGQDFDFSDISEETPTARDNRHEEDIANESIELPGIDISALENDYDTPTANGPVPDFDTGIVTLDNDAAPNESAPTAEDFSDRLEDLFTDNTTLTGTEAEDDNDLPFSMTEEAAPEEMLPSVHAEDDLPLVQTDIISNQELSGDDISNQLSALFSDDNDASTDLPGDSVEVDLIPTGQSPETVPNSEYATETLSSYSFNPDNTLSPEELSLDAFDFESDSSGDISEENNAIAPDSIDLISTSSNTATNDLYIDDDLLPFEEQTIIINRTDATSEADGTLADIAPAFSIPTDGESLGDNLDLLFPEDNTRSENAFLSIDNNTPAPDIDNDNELTGIDVLNRINDIFQPEPAAHPDSRVVNAASPSGDDVSDRIDSFFEPPQQSTNTNVEKSDSGTLPEPTDEITLPVADHPADLSIEEMPSSLSLGNYDDTTSQGSPSDIFNRTPMNDFQTDASETIFDQLLPQENNNSEMQSMPSFDEISSFDAPAEEELVEDEFTPPAFAETLQFDSALFDKMLNPDEENDDTLPAASEAMSYSSPLDGATEELDFNDNDNFDVVDLPLAGPQTGNTRGPFSSFTDNTEVLPDLDATFTDGPREDLILESTATFEFPHRESDNMSLDLDLLSEAENSADTSDDIDLSELITDDTNSISRLQFDSSPSSRATQHLADGPSGADVAGQIDALFSENNHGAPRSASPDEKSEVVDLTEEYLLEDLAEFTSNDDDEESDVSLIETMQFSNELISEPEETSGQFGAETEAEPPHSSLIGDFESDTPDSSESTSMISSSDIEERLDAFFPSADLMSLSSSAASLPEDEFESVEQSVSEFYTISGEDAVSTSEEAIPEALDDVEFIDEDDLFSQTAAPIDNRQIYSAPLQESFVPLQVPPAEENLFEDFPAETVAYTQEELSVPPSDTPDERDAAFDIPDHVLTPTLADLYFQQGQYSFALKVFSRLLQQDPDNQKLVSRYNEIKAIVDFHENNPAAAQRDKESTHRKKPPRQQTSSSVPEKMARPLAGVRIKKSVKTTRKSTKRKSDGNQT